MLTKSTGQGQYGEGNKMADIDEAEGSKNN